MITLHTLHASQTRRRPKRVGRGNSSGKGTTAGRGTKGQRARTGGRNKLGRRSLKHLIERTPKVRGFTSSSSKIATVDIADLQRVFADGAIVTAVELHHHGLLRHSSREVKILGNTGLQKKLTVKANAFSKAAAEAIRRVGGTVVELQPPAAPAKPETT